MKKTKILVIILFCYMLLCGFSIANDNRVTTNITILSSDAETTVPEMLNQTYDSIDILLLIIRTLAYIFSFIGILSIGKIKSYIRRWHLYKLLGFKLKYPLEIMLPTMKGNLTFTPSEIIKIGAEKVPQYDYISLYESESLLHVQNLLSEYGFKNKVILKIANDNFSKESNKLIIGGPLSSKYLHDMFSSDKDSIFSFKGRFKFCVSSDWLNWMTREFNAPLLDIVEELKNNDEEKKLLYWDKNNNKKSIPIQHKYIILIKLNKEDLHMSNSGPMIICFGNEGMTTNNAVKCLTESLYELVKYIKNKKHFFIVFRCTSRGDIQFSNENVIDLTDVML